MDYVIDPIALTDGASKLIVKWREHSFLENPRCPDSVKHSILNIHMSTVRDGHQPLCITTKCLLPG